ncbi:uncharacterized protein V6R79_022508 [Siganus canaliculatus]
MQHMMWIFAAAFILLTDGLSAEYYGNAFGGTLFIKCPSKQVVSRVKSSHESSENDRQWKFECKALDARGNCTWSGYHNLNEKELSFNCPANHVIAAVYSLYENGDRSWNFQCCSVPNLITFDCRDTPKINYFNEDFDWHVPGDNFLTGVHTHGKNNDGDHRWSFSYCRGTQESPSEVLAAEPPPGTYLAEGDVIVPIRSKRSAKVCSNCRWSKSGQTVQDGKQHNFNKHETNNLNIPYDYSSIMHYGAKYFSKNGEDTITPLKPSVQIGKRSEMSESDVLKINKLYNCTNYLHKYDDWDNKLTAVLSHQCPSGQAVSGITSIYNDDKKDRLFGISCKAFTASTTCRWSSYVNNYWENMNFACPDNQVITGVYSKYCSTLQDRRWKFRCCRANGISTFNCKTTPKINYWNELFNWKVPGSNFLTGVGSSFDPDNL